MNPGPVRNPCGFFCRPVAKNHRAVQCEACYFWHHIKCENISPTEYSVLCGDDKPWICTNCTNFHFSDSFFESSNESTISEESINYNVFEELAQVRKSHPRKLISGHLNINSLRYKFDEIKPLLIDKIVDILFISESKLDESFRDQLLQVDGYRLEQRDRNEFGGGIVAFVRSDISIRRRKELEMAQTESVLLEVKINDSKWAILCVYRPPSQSNETFSHDMFQCLDKCSTFFDNHLLLGDLNNDIFQQLNLKL